MTCFGYLESGPNWPKGAIPFRLVLQRVQRCGHAAAAMREHGTCMIVNGHDRRIAEEPTEIETIADLLADCGDEAHGGRLVVDHADCAFVRDDAEYRFLRCVTGNRNHVETDRAHAGHGFELLKR